MIFQGHAEPGEALSLWDPSLLGVPCVLLSSASWKVLIGQSHVLALVSEGMMQNLQATEMEQHFFLG